MADTDPPASEAAAKPARRRSATPAKTAAKRRVAKPKAEAAPSIPAKTKAKAPPKPRSTKRASPATAPAPRKSATRGKSAVKTATEKVGGAWGAAAIGAGLVAAGGVAAALLSLRGSSEKPNAGKGKARTADGTDATKSFEAGIADEGTVPEQGKRVSE